MKNLLISFFYSDNLGDLLIADRLEKFSSEYFKTKKVSYGANYLKYSNLNDIKPRENINSVNKKVVLLRLISRLNLDKALLLLLKFKKSKNDMILESLIKETDIVTIGGGNMIFDVDKYSTAAFGFEKIIKMSKENNKKVFVISIGIGPFFTEKQEKAACRALSKCDYITFRDMKSYDIYKKYHSINNAFITVDPVFLLEHHITHNNYKNDKQIALNLIDIRLAKESNNKHKAVKEGYKKLLLYLNKKGYKITLFSTDIHDYPLIYEIHGEINKQDITIFNVTGFDSLMMLYEKIDILLGCRMHSLIIAYTQRIPVIGFSWQQKIDGFFEKINDQNSVFKYDEIEDNLFEIEQLLEFKLNNFSNEKENIDKNINLLKLEFDINREIIKEIIKAHAM